MGTPTGSGAHFLSLVLQSLQANQQAQTLLQMLSPKQAEPQQAPLPSQYFPSQQPSHADIARLMQAAFAARDGSPGMTNGPSQNFRRTALGMMAQFFQQVRCCCQLASNVVIWQLTDILRSVESI